MKGGGTGLKVWWDIYCMGRLQGKKEMLSKRSRTWRHREERRPRTTDQLSAHRRLHGISSHLSGPAFSWPRGVLTRGPAETALGREWPAPLKSGSAAFLMLSCKWVCLTAHRRWHASACTLKCLF